MSNDPGVRRILPQNSQMGTISFAPPAVQQPREQQKNYVFVDEHNRHKRLKVMRACEGCRRRKIKCDAATTNTWPCSACVRLKLHCVRPNGFESSDEPYDQPAQQFETANIQDDFRQHVSPQEQPPLLATGAKSGSAMYAPQPDFADNFAFYDTAHYPDTTGVTSNLHYTTVPAAAHMVDQSFPTQADFITPPLQHGVLAQTPSDGYLQEQYGQQDLADLLGSLKVNEAGTAPYLNSKMRPRDTDEEPALEDADEYKSLLPPLVSAPGLKIRIPPELMPDDDTVLHYFDLYFTHVHPYVPVLDKARFYQQWQTSRDSISPLLIEAIFAIAGRLADDPALGQQWLALATRHADSFMDVPRLSTLQALLIVLKARESAPKRGYYYRSWMSIVQCVQMGKDLGLDEHFADHQAGQPCGSSTAECMLKTRIWQTIFVCEVMIGSPQGRTDLSVDPKSVDLSIPTSWPNGDESEHGVTRQWTYFARMIRNISRMNKLYGRIKNTKDWGIMPEFAKLGPDFHKWLDDLPPDLNVTYPPDGSAPWLPSPFIGNLHSYYYLSLILYHRPQLAFLEPTSPNTADQWKKHMSICYDSAKLLCRLQEGVLQTAGLTGLQCMQRGVNFTIYAVLGCIVLHLVALTSPDPDLNWDAREYFARHMRILEKCMVAWPMPDMQKQVDAVREAFSADTRKPFVLKPSFPYGSPSSTSRSTPPTSLATLTRADSAEQNLSTQSMQQPSHLAFSAQSITPPISAGLLDIKNETHTPQSLAMMAGTQAPTLQQTVPLSNAPIWNPTRIFDQWNTTFQLAPPSAASQASNLGGLAGASQAASMQNIQAAQTQFPINHVTNQQFAAAVPTVPTFVTPAMWQESVASVYEGGFKRAWDYDGNMRAGKRR